MKSTSFLFLFIVVSLVCLSASKGLSQTEVQGEVTGVWDLDGNPYLVVGEIAVPNNQSLTIEAGVEILTDSGISFFVYGTLVAEGTEEDSIYFGPSEQNDGWGGLRFLEADEGTRLNYCIVEYGLRDQGEGGGSEISAGGNIFIRGGEVIIRHSRISFGRTFGFGGGIAIWESDPEIENCLINENSSAHNGGGIQVVHGSSPTIIECRFIANLADRTGGGICIESISDPRIVNCTFELNTARGGGGGLFTNLASSPILSHCIFRENHAENGGGAYLMHEGSQPVFEWCDFIRNTCPGGEVNHGGGILLRDNVDADIYYCRFIRNETGIGGGIAALNNPESNIHHNLFYENRGFAAGGALSLWGNFDNQIVEIQNCTFINNTGGAQWGNVAFIAQQARLDFTSSIIWGELPHFWQNERVNVTYSNIKFGWEGEGNSEENPGLFVLDSSWCLLAGDSPCIDTGNPDLPEDSDNSTNDRGWVHFPQNALASLEADTLEAEVEPGEQVDVTLEFRNETTVPIYASPVESWQEGVGMEIIDISEITDDYEIKGVAWTEDGYFISGGNNGEDPNQIYHLDENYQLINQFDQPGGSEGAGYLDLGSGGGHLIYGGDEDKIVEFSTQGELGEQYFDPAGFEVYRALAVDHTFNDGMVDIYYAGFEGTIIRGDDEMWEQDRFEFGFPIKALAMKGNVRAVYILPEPNPEFNLISMVTVDDGRVTPQLNLTPPDEGYVLGGLEVTQRLENGYGMLIGIWEGEGDRLDRMFTFRLYTTWLIVEADFELLKPGEEAVWGVTFTAEQMPGGVYDSEFYFTINGWGEGGEIPARIFSPNSSPIRNESAYPVSVLISTVYPNPFNSVARFSYTLQNSGLITISLFDINGKTAFNMTDGWKPAGTHTGTLNGKMLPAGKYYIQFSTLNGNRIYPVTILK